MFHKMNMLWKSVITIFLAILSMSNGEMFSFDILLRDEIISAEVYGDVKTNQERVTWIMTPNITGNSPDWSFNYYGSIFFKQQLEVAIDLKKMRCFLLQYTEDFYDIVRSLRRQRSAKKVKRLNCKVYEKEQDMEHNFFENIVSKYATSIMCTKFPLTYIKNCEDVETPTDDNVKDDKTKCKLFAFYNNEMVCIET